MTWTCSGTISGTRPAERYGRRRRRHTGPWSGCGRSAVVVGGLLLLWLVLLALLWRARPDELTARGALRLLPDVVRLVRRLAADGSLARGGPRPAVAAAGLSALADRPRPGLHPGARLRRRRGRGGLGAAVGVRRAGAEALARHWPGEPAGLAVVSRLAGLPPTGRPPAEQRRPWPAGRAAAGCPHERPELVVRAPPAAAVVVGGSPSRRSWRWPAFVMAWRRNEGDADEHEHPPGGHPQRARAASHQSGLSRLRVDLGDGRRRRST